MCIVAAPLADSITTIRLRERPAGSRLEELLEGKFTLYNILYIMHKRALICRSPTPRGSSRKPLIPRTENSVFTFNSSLEEGEEEDDDGEQVQIRRPIRYLLIKIDNTNDKKE